MEGKTKQSPQTIPPSLLNVPCLGVYMALAAQAGVRWEWSTQQKPQSGVSILAKFKLIS